MLRPREEGGSGRHFGRRNVTFSVLGASGGRRCSWCLNSRGSPQTSNRRPGANGRPPPTHSQSREKKGKEENDKFGTVTEGENKFLKTER